MSILKKMGIITLSDFIEKLVNILAFFIIARYYPLKEIGLFYFIGAIVGIIFSVIGGSTFTFLLTNKEKKEQVTTFSIVLNSLLALFLFIPLSIFVFSKYVGQYIFLVFLWSYFIAISPISTANLFIERKYKRHLLANITASLFKLVVIFLPFVLNIPPTFGFIAFAQVVVFLTKTFFGIDLVFTNIFSYLRNHIIKKRIFSFLPFLAKYYISTLVAMTKNKIDIVLLKIWIPLEDIGIYGIAKAFVSNIAFIYFWYFSVIPDFDKEKNKFFKITIFLSITVFFFFLFNYERFISIIYGIKYVEKTKMLVPILLGGLLLSGLGGFGNVKHLYEKKIEQIVFFQAFSISIFITIMFFLTPLFGIVGAVTATFFGDLSYFLFLNKKILKNYLSEYTLKVILASIGMVFCIFVPFGTLFFERVFWLGVSSFVAIASFLFFSYILKINEVFIFSKKVLKRINCIAFFK